MEKLNQLATIGHGNYSIVKSLILVVPLELKKKN